MTQKVKTYDQKPMLVTVLKMAWPAVLESFFVSLAGLIDTLMVSSLGTSAVSSIGLTTQPKFLALALFMSCNIALSALVARRVGEGDRKSANEILVTALIYTVIASIIISVLTVVFAGPIISFCGSNADTHEGGVLYFSVIEAGLIFNTLSLCINAAQRGSGNTKIAMTTNVTSSIVNIIFNYLLIQGNFGFPKWGLFGAAFATVLGTVVACIMSIRSLFNKKSYVSVKYILDNRIKASIEQFKTIFSLSSNFLIENVAMRVGFIVTAIMAAKLGTEPFAAHQVGMNFLGIGFSFGDGMQVAAVALIGRSLGERKAYQAVLYGKLCQRIGLVISICLAAFLLVFGRSTYGLFFTDPTVIDMGVLIARYTMVIVLFQISQVIFGGCLRGAGDVKYTLKASLISVTIIRSVVTWALAGGIFQWGLHGIWIGVLADQVSRFIFLSIRFKQGDWVELKI